MPYLLIVYIKKRLITREIKIISQRFMFHNYVNCYLIKADNHYFLIDTGMPNKRKVIEKELKSAGCRPGNLTLIILTHGDLDHAGNAAYFRITEQGTVVNAQ